ncbi:MAG: class I SAM-dependent methyltransferase [Pseudolabrys sp.]
MLPDAPALALDVGAGTGRDAAWLTSRGLEVVAVEPSGAMRANAERLHPSPSIRWISDSLPGLDHVHRLGLSFDLILLSAVWMHIAPADRAHMAGARTPDTVGWQRISDEPYRAAAWAQRSVAGSCRLELALDQMWRAQAAGPLAHCAALAAALHGSARSTDFAADHSSAMGVESASCHRDESRCGYPRAPRRSAKAGALERRPCRPDRAQARTVCRRW